MKLALSKRARADYKAIRAYSLRQFGPQQAAAYRERFETAFERLLAFPESGAPSDTLHRACGGFQLAGTACFTV